MDNYSICYSLFLSIRLVQKRRIADFGDRKDDTFSNTSYTCHFYLDGKRKWETRMVTLIPGCCKNVFYSITNWRKSVNMRWGAEGKTHTINARAPLRVMKSWMRWAWHVADLCMGEITAYETWENWRRWTKNGTIILKQILNEKGATT
jgi:hypothetical protein